MALLFIYEVIRMDGTEYKMFHSQKKAETYAVSIKRSPSEKVQITRTGKKFAPHVYYV